MVSCTNTVSTAAPLLSSSVTAFLPYTIVESCSVLCSNLSFFFSARSIRSLQNFQKSPARPVPAHCAPHAACAQPRSGLNKTALAAVLRVLTFSNPCAPARPRVPGARAAAQAAGLRLFITRRRAAASTKPHLLRFCVFQRSQTHAHQRIRVCPAHAQSRASGGFARLL